MPWFHSALPCIRPRGIYFSWRLKIMHKGQEKGALVISLDFELYWGVRDSLPGNAGYWENIKGERAAVRAILDIFREYEIAATWATVGFLFARSREHLGQNTPAVLPQYRDPGLSPYLDDLSQIGGDDSLFFALDLIEEIKETPRQEIATHTFSHFYCLDEGQTAEAFEADIERAVQMAAERSIKISSIVFPRNQHNPEYDEILLGNGIVCYRGNQSSRMYQFDTATLNNPYFRATRLADTFLNVSGHNTFGWDTIFQGPIANVPASIFLRPVSDHDSVLSKMQFRRISKSLEFAADNAQIFHLWWHPHNFGTSLDTNINFLRRILDRYCELRGEHGIESLTMIETAQRAATVGAASRA